MTRDPLEALLRFREAAKDEAKRAFAAALAREAAFRKRLDALDARIRHEREAATSLTAGDGTVEAYMAWLPTARGQTKAAQDSCDRAAADVDVARAAMRAAHAAAEAIASFLEQRAETAKDIAAKRSQAALDEIAARKAGADPSVTTG